MSSGLLWEWTTASQVVTVGSAWYKQRRFERGAERTVIMTLTTNACDWNNAVFARSCPDITHSVLQLFSFALSHLNKPGWSYFRVLHPVWHSVETHFIGRVSCCVTLWSSAQFHKSAGRSPTGNTLEYLICTLMKRSTTQYEMILYSDWHLFS